MLIFCNRHSVVKLAKAKLITNVKLGVACNIVRKMLCSIKMEIRKTDVLDLILKQGLFNHLIP